MQDMFIRVWCDAVNRFKEVRSGERGATAVEYGIMVALIAAVIILVVTAVGEKTNNAFEKVNANLP
jgi:pilus assembly protein Flp/PilA